MKFVIHPAIEPRRPWARARGRRPTAEWVNAADTEATVDAMPGADAFLGKITPEALARADRLRWVQAFTASLEHYLFPALIAHPCTLTNMRGLFSDVIADQVLGYILCFARNLHTYVRRQVEHRYEPVGGESARVSFATGPGVINEMDRATIYLPAATLGIVGLGAIGSEIARRALAFGMTVRAIDRHPAAQPHPHGGHLGRGNRPARRAAGRQRFPRYRRPTDTRDDWPVQRGNACAPPADELPDQHRPRCDRRPRRPGGRPPRPVGSPVQRLDVFEVEPLPADHPLWNFPNVIVTPHTAGYAPVIAARHLATLVENVRHFVRDAPLTNVVDKNLWY